MIKKQLFIKFLFSLTMLVIFRIGMATGGLLLQCESIAEISSSPKDNDANGHLYPIVAGIKVVYQEMIEEHNEKVPNLKVPNLNDTLMKMAALLHSHNTQDSFAVINLIKEIVQYFNQEAKYSFELKFVTHAAPAFYTTLTNNREIKCCYPYESLQYDNNSLHKGVHTNTHEYMQDAHIDLEGKVRKQVHALCAPAQRQQYKAQNTIPFSIDVDNNDFSVLCLPCDIKSYGSSEPGEPSHYAVFIFQNIVYNNTSVRFVRIENTSFEGGINTTTNATYTPESDNIVCNTTTVRPVKIENTSIEGGLIQ
ncbi:MAG: hypothetical protein QS721_08425 [Candidatus Endonucleobacter sp. (ex Gigantidas childressi)]|nr:hypothetical protein [Candidatus Endonucleobacter sp. (ex Gigantidas childressi)]